MNALRSRPLGRRLLLALAAVAVAVLLVSEGTQTRYVPTAAATVLSGALAVAAVVVPRPRFTAVAVAAAVASGTLTVVTTHLTHRPATTFGLTELCALLLVATRAVRQSPPLPAAAVACCALVAGGIAPLRLPETEYTSLDLLEPLLLFGAALAVVLGLYLRLFDRGRERERRAALQDQRLEYARELHDFVAHHVTAMVAQTKAVRFATTAGHGPSPEELDGMLARIEEAGSEAMESMRGTVSVLRDPADPAAGGLSRLRPLVAAFAKSGPPVELTIDPRVTDRNLSPEVSATAHRLVRESLTNVRKHATGVRRVVVTLRLRSDTPEGVEVTVHDDGRPGGTERRARRRGGYGLLGLTERVEALGGTFSAGPAAAGSGWRVTALLPGCPPGGGSPAPGTMGP